MFEIFSKTNPEVNKTLITDSPWRSWASLVTEEKERIWLHLNYYLFNPNRVNSKGHRHLGGVSEHLSINADERIFEQMITNSVCLTAATINNNYKFDNYTPSFLKSKDKFSAGDDFYNIFINGDETLLYQMLSIYIKHLSNPQLNGYVKEKLDFVRNFIESIEDTFKQFYVDMMILDDGFMPRQEERIIEDVYTPVLRILAAPRRVDVDKELKSAFDCYIEGTKKGYGRVINHTVISVETLLRVLLFGDIKKGGTLSTLISDYIKKMEVNKKDLFLSNTLDYFEKTSARIRKEKGEGAHTQHGKANEQEARTFLNLGMVLIQHILQTDIQE